MLRNYALIAFRQLRRQKVYTLINVGGLAVGLACCLLIALFVRDELSYDRFHEKADRIYRVVTPGRLMMPPGLAQALEGAFPVIERTVRLGRSWFEVHVEHDDVSFFETEFFFTDSTIFDVFDVPLLRGDPRSALIAPYSVVITESVAKKYFGTADPMGETLTVSSTRGTHDLMVTGVAREVPDNSHVHFDFLASNTTIEAVTGEPLDTFRWSGPLTYVLLHSPEDRDVVARKLPIFQLRVQPGSRDSYLLQALADIHLESNYPDEFELNSDIRYIYIFSIVAALILLIACVNYMNLATAQSGKRAKEVGIRKTSGAGRSQLVRQFMSESILLSLISVFGAVAVAQMALPLFNQVTGKALSLRYGDPFWIAVLIVTGVVVGLVSGVYPAFFLSSFRPVRVLKGVFRAGRGSAAFRNGLVVTQFVLSSALIVGAVVTSRQMDHIRTMRLGLNTDQVAVLETRRLDHETYDAFKNALLQHSAIESVANSGSPIPLDDRRGSLSPVGVPEEDHGKIFRLFVSPDFLKTLEVDVVAGEDLPNAITPADHFPAIINETAAKRWGWEDPIGRTLHGFSPTPVVVGVSEDFHFRSLREEIEPLVLVGWESPFYVLVRMRTDNVSGTLAYIRDRWADFGPGAPLDYTFLDERFEGLYQADQRLARIFGIFSAIAVGIACLGLLGLAAYAVEQRTKEIGIRKVLGATAAGIVLLFSRDFVRLILIGFVLSAPLSYLAMSRWLEDFAYRIDLGPGIYLIAAGLTILVAAVAVGAQVLRAAHQDPVECLRYE